MLSDHIEKRLFNRLKEEREEWAKDSKKELNEVIYNEHVFTFCLILTSHKS